MEEQADFEQELRQMLGAVEHDLCEASARGQSMAANSMLALMGRVDFSKLNPADQISLTYDIFRLSCYALGGMPVVLKAVSIANGMSQEQSVAAVIRMFGLLFKFDPSSVIETMLGPRGPAARADLSGLAARQVRCDD